MGGKLEDKHWYDDIPISVETGLEVKVTAMWNQQCKLTEPLLKVNRIS
jgi:hypothetical protein